MAFRYKIDIMQSLKNKGYSTYRIRKERLFGEKTLQDFRNGNVVFSESCFDKLCCILDLQPGDLLSYIPDEEIQKNSSISDEEMEMNTSGASFGSPGSGEAENG